MFFIKSLVAGCCKGDGFWGSRAVVGFSMGKDPLPPQTPLPHPKSQCSRWWHGDPWGKEGWGLGRDIGGGTFALCVPPGFLCRSRGRLMGLIINVGPLMSAGAAPARGCFTTGCNPCGMRDWGCGVGGPAASPGSARRKMGAPSSLRGLAAASAAAALGKEREGAERSRWMFLFPGQPSKSPGGSRCDGKAAPGSSDPARSPAAAGKGWSGPGAVPRLAPLRVRPLPPRPGIG